METISVRELVSRYSRELVRLNYAKNTRKNYEVFWNQLIASSTAKSSPSFQKVSQFSFSRTATDCRRYSGDVG